MYRPSVPVPKTEGGSLNHTASRSGSSGDYGENGAPPVLLRLATLLKATDYTLPHLRITKPQTPKKGGEALIVPAKENAPILPADINDPSDSRADLKSMQRETGGKRSHSPCREIKHPGLCAQGTSRLLQGVREKLGGLKTPTPNNVRRLLQSNLQSWMKWQYDFPKESVSLVLMDDLIENLPAPGIIESRYVLNYVEEVAAV